MVYPNLLKRLTVGFVKLLSTHPIHIVVWGNFPFKGFTSSAFNQCNIERTEVDGYFGAMVVSTYDLSSKKGAGWGRGGRVGGRNNDTYEL